MSEQRGTRRDDGPPRKPDEATCEEALAVVYEFLDGELDPECGERVRRHLERCRRCWPYFDFERHFLDGLHETAGEGTASPDLVRRVRALLDDA
jgi:anti-sigma factor (TIGR02949 family)